MFKSEAEAQHVGDSDTFGYVLTPRDPSSHLPHLHVCLPDTKPNRKKMVDSKEIYDKHKLVGIGRVVLDDITLKNKIKYSPLDVRFDGDYSPYLKSRLGEIADWLNQPCDKSPTKEPNWKYFREKYINTNGKQANSNRSKKNYH